MKKNFKGIIIGFLAAALLFSGIVAAKPDIVWKNIGVAFGDYKVVIDGVPFEAKDKNGVLEPFSYNGWIWAPFEHIARALGMPSYWDGATTTLYLGNRDGRREQMLFDQPTVSVGVPGQFTASGNAQQNNIMLNRSGFSMHFAGLNNASGTSRNHIEYNTAALATDFRATLHPHPSADVSIVYRIYGDGRLLHAPPMLLSHMAPIPIDVDIRGVRVLRIEMEITNSSRSSRNMNNWLGIENARILVVE